ncbi:MAG TPA: cupredoxin domain-containing protein [Myxococcota bacterium]|nr:cupredoxin domain-containing protein [Myxococcota bacterium]
MSICQSPLVLLVPLLALVAQGCAHGHGHGGEGHYHAFSSDVSTVQVVTALVGGKNVFIPSTIVVTDGGPRALSVFNTTEMPHGFAIKALGIEVVLPPGQETRIELPKLEARQVLQIGCHMHPAHRTATLVVLPGEAP